MRPFRCAKALPNGIYRDGVTTLRQLLYLSRATNEMTESDLRDLLEEARRLNTVHGITGLLLFADMHFIQCIEGTSEAIAQLAENIRGDARNEEFSVLIDHQVGERSFRQWSMGFKASSVSDLRLEEGFHDLQRLEDLARIENAKGAIFNIMQRFYMQNAGFSLG